MIWVQDRCNFKCETMVAYGWGRSLAPPTKLHSKWSKLYRIVTVKVVFATVEDPKTWESITVHVVRLTFSSPSLRDELTSENFGHFDVPVRSLSNASLHALFRESPLDPPTLATPIHAPSPTPGS